MVTISLSMIVKNEEETLARCLDSVCDIVDEIIIVDTGSTDKTVEIAARFTDNVLEFAWIDDFSAARNFSFSKATQDYVLWLDADDVILEEDRNKLIHLKARLDPSVDIVMMKYNLSTGQYADPFCTYFRERLLKRSRNYQWYDPVHEYIDPSGHIISVDIAVTHQRVRSSSPRNLAILDKMVAEGKDLSLRNCFYYARELYLNGDLEKAKIYYEKFLSGEGGFISNYIDSCIDLSRIYVREGRHQDAIRALLLGFEFGVPRAEICCELGTVYKEMGDLHRAVTWFQAATIIPKPENVMGAVVHDCYGYIPWAEMAICLYRLGRFKEAIECNEHALVLKPDSAVVKHNQEFLAALPVAEKATAGYRLWPPLGK
ncbi:MAG: glycosyltransferase [Candidatus Saccharibacteria bacterium]